MLELPPSPHLHKEPDEAVKKKLGVGFWICAAWVGGLALAALLAPLLPLRDPERGVKVNDAGEVCAPEGSQTGCSLLSLEAPFVNPDVPLGTNRLGRDMLSMTIWGARISLTVSVLAIAFGTVVGGTIGLLAGYFKGPTESVLMGFMDVMLAFPPLILAMCIVAFRDNDRSVFNVVLALGLVAVPSVARLVRANTLIFAEREFVLAARTLGAKNLRVLVREVVPNVLPIVVSFIGLAVAVAIVAEGLLAFLGLSVDAVTWGGMINDGRDDLEEHAYLSMIPCFAMWLTIMTLNFASDRLRQFFDVKESAL